MSEASRVTMSEGRADLWICEDSCKNLQLEDIVIDWCEMDEAYVPMPFFKHKLDPQ